MDDRLDFMEYLATEAGKIMMGFYGNELESTIKEEDGSPVTIADLKVSELVQAEISKRFPHDGLLDEEAKDSLERLTKKGVWIVDPIDDTGGFKAEGDGFSFLCAYTEYGIPLVGVVYEPKKGRMFLAKKGSGAYLKQGNDAVKLGALNSITWDKSIVGHPETYKGDKYKRLYELMGIPEERLKYAGGMGTRMMQVAMQETHIILGYTKSLKEWDIAAGHVILEEMGVSVTDMFGQPLKYNQKDPKTHKGILVVHPDIKQVTLEKLAQCYESVKM